MCGSHASLKLRMVRLYVGGLPAGITEEELRQRFLPFGEVTDCRIAPPKVYAGEASFPRNFGHVELQPKDEAALRKCLSAYNGGCKWKGSLLKCGVARQHYVDRLQEERQAAEAAAGAAGDNGQASQVCPRRHIVCSLFIEQNQSEGDATARTATAWHPAGFFLQDSALATEEATAAHGQQRQRLPPLVPRTTLWLRPPRTAAPIQVQLGSGTKKQQFPDQRHTNGSQQQRASRSWAGLPAPPGGGYQFELHLQRLAANPPPELLAAVEERRKRGQQLAAALEQRRQEAAGARGARRVEGRGSSGVGVGLGAGDWGGYCLAHGSSRVSECPAWRPCLCGSSQRHRLAMQKNCGC